MATKKTTEKAAETVAEVKQATETEKETATAETVAEETKQAAETEKETQTVAEEAPKKPAREKIFIPRGYANDDPNFFVSVNGVNYLLPRGKESEVPAHVAAEIRRAWKAQERLDERRDQMLEAAKQ